MSDVITKGLVLLGPGYRGRWALVILLALLVSGSEVIGALLVFWLLAIITTDRSGFELPIVGDIRNVVPGDELVAMAVVGALIALFFVLRGTAVVAQAYVQHRVAENAGARLSARLLDGYLAMPYSFHLGRNSAELVRNAYDTVQQFVRDALLPTVKLVSHSLMIAGLVTVLLVTSPVATLLAAAVLGPMTWLLLGVVHPRVKRLGQTAQLMAKTSLQTLHEALAGWRDIKILGRQRSFVDSFRNDRRRLARARYLRSTARELPRVALETGLVLFIVALFGVSVIVGGGALNALPVLGLFGYAAFRLLPSLNEVVAALNALRFIGPGIDHIHDDIQAFEAAATRMPRRTGVVPLPLRVELRLEGVAARYPDATQDALTDIDLTVRAGEFIGIVGPTGGGKSTLVDLMLGLLDPSAGRVTVDGADIKDHLDAWHASLGVVHQVVFLADTSLRRNIALGAAEEEIDETLVTEAVRLAQLEEFVASLPGGLDTVVGEDGVRLSGGQRQRLAIARALYRRPSVMVFDEGTSALDSNTEAGLMAAIDRLRSDRTIIVVAHRLTTVHEADRVVLIDAGRMIDVGPFDQLAAHHGRLLQARG